MTRFFDIILSFFALLVFFPFGIIIMLILRFTGEGEIFYTQTRIGKNGRNFGLLKFATMLKNSPAIGTGDITIKNDPRVLPLGHFLRKTKINEIPQLINILVGDMSIVGPRPQTPKNFKYFTPKEKEVILLMRPGLTGIGSIVFRDEETYTSQANDPIAFYDEVIQPYKGELELWYYENKSLRVDASLVFLTAWVILFPKSQLVYRMFRSLPVKDMNEAVKNFNDGKLIK
ncbi:MAG: sugar transferase [Prevotellaceae bacterium]|jgi:lipopolysaccharide/colanic/teichoic acid biosynthesis glycosyltransferase|nr:sugar transferase [Prevotellaceae bacterium]